MADRVGNVIKWTIRHALCNKLEVNVPRAQSLILSRSALTQWVTFSARGRKQHTTHSTSSHWAWSPAFWPQSRLEQLQVSAAWTPWRVWWAPAVLRGGGSGGGGVGGSCGHWWDEVDISLRRHEFDGAADQDRKQHSQRNGSCSDPINSLSTGDESLRSFY